MTTAELLAQIRAEIEKRREHNIKYNLWKADEDDALLAFIDTLSVEENVGTMDDNGLNWEDEVVLDEDGFPYIKTINFHDCDTEKPLFNFGDKVIVQIRKKEEQHE